MTPRQLLPIVVAIALVAALLSGCSRSATKGEQPTVEERIERARKAMKSANPTARAMSATALGELGPEAREAVPDLEALLKDRDPKVREAARNALEKIRKQGD